MYRDVSASIVLYHHNLGEVRSLLEQIAMDRALEAWVVVNNGGADEACAYAELLGAHCLHPGKNLGYGSAHNLALRSLAGISAPYHLILNPDISMKNGVLSELAAVMDELKDVGLLMPRVLSEDGSTQYLCKLLPTPFDLILRRFAVQPLRNIFHAQMARYDMKSFDYSRPVYVPVLSGCFMFTRRAVLEAVGGFDERFFLYMEDTDLCRRIGGRSKLLFWPNVTVTHAHAQGSYKHFSLLKLHLRAAIDYFNKWGWFTDRERRILNEIGIQDVAADPSLIRKTAKEA